MSTWPEIAALPQPTAFRPEAELYEGQIQEGVYFLLDLSGKPLYVGQAVDILRRLDEHRGIADIRDRLNVPPQAPKDFHRLIWTPVKGHSERVRIEGIFILAFTPPLNRALDLWLHDGNITQRNVRAEITAAQSRKAPAERPHVDAPARRSVEKSNRNRRTRSPGVHPGNRGDKGR